MRARWTRPAGRSLALAGTAAVLASCAYNYAMTPYLECLLLRGGNCTDRGRSSPLTGVYARSSSAACFASAAVGWSRYGLAARAYDARVRAHDAYKSTTVAAATAAAAAAGASGHATFGAFVLAACALLIVPVNAARLTAMAAERRPVLVLVYMALMYAHNVVLCLWECRFVAMCHALYVKFADVNRDLEAVGRRIEDPVTGADYDRVADRDRRRNRFGHKHCDGDPGTMDRRLEGAAASHRRWARSDDNNDTTDRGGHCRPDDCGSRGGGDDDGDRWVAGYDDAGHYFYRSRATGRPLADAVERLKIRHRLIREAVNDLKYAFTVPVGASLCNLCVLALFDVYELAIDSAAQKTDPQRFMLVALWLTQYGFRFFAIVGTAHATTNQALKSKRIISFLNKNFLDIETKEELQVFFKQISSTSMEFTIYDLFSLKTHLFTSAIGVCITYLMIILQIKWDNEQTIPKTP